MLDPKHTSFEASQKALEALLKPYLSGQTTTPQADHAWHQLLAQYQRSFSEQLSHDLAFNLEQLEQAASIQGSDHVVFQDSLKRLHRFEQELHDTHKAALRWYICQRFYSNALALAEYLIPAKQQPMPVLGNNGTLRRSPLGFGAYHHAQGFIDSLENLVPNHFSHGYWRYFVPYGLYILYHQLWPWSRYSHTEFAKTLLPWFRGFPKIREQAGEGVQMSTSLSGEYLEELFDEQGLARHNLIWAYSHRLGYLDSPLIATFLHRVFPHVFEQHASWMNAANFSPRIKAKMDRDPKTIFVQGTRRTFRGALDASVANMVSGTSIFIASEGLQSSLVYGQQLSLEKGVRLLADESVRQMKAQGLKRKTFVIPVTASDPIGFVVGQTNKLIIHAHRPIEITEASRPETYRSKFDKTQYNGGDPLLNHLEALFLLHTSHLSRGWHTPDVLAAVRYKREQHYPWGPGAYLRKRSKTSLFELSRYSIARKMSL